MVERADAAGGDDGDFSRLDEFLRAPSELQHLGDWAGALATSALPSLELYTHEWELRLVRRAAAVHVDARPRPTMSSRAAEIPLEGPESLDALRRAAGDLPLTLPPSK